MLTMDNRHPSQQVEETCEFHVIEVFKLVVVAPRTGMLPSTVGVSYVEQLQMTCKK